MAGFESLAALIVGAALCMLVLPALAGAGLGYLTLRRTRAKWAGIVGGAALGLFAGGIAVAATFFEDAWNPPVEVVLEVPAGFAHEWVYVVGDPAATIDLDVPSRGLPMVQRHVSIPVPASGVVRVRDLSEIDGAYIEGVLSIAGARRANSGRASMNAPGLGAGRVVAFSFMAYPGTEPDISLMSPAAITAFVTAREAER